MRWKVCGNYLKHCIVFSRVFKGQFSWRILLLNQAVYTKSDQSSMYPYLVTFRLLSCFYRSYNSLLVFTGYFVQKFKICALELTFMISSTGFIPSQKVSCMLETCCKLSETSIILVESVLFCSDKKILPHLWLKSISFTSKIYQEFQCHATKLSL